MRKIEKNLFWFLSGITVAAVILNRPLIQINLTKFKSKTNAKK